MADEEDEMLMEAAMEDHVSQELVEQDAAKPDAEVVKLEPVTKAETDIPTAEVEETLDEEGIEIIQEDRLTVDLEHVPNEESEDDELKTADEEEIEDSQKADDDHKEDDEKNKEREDETMRIDILDMDLVIGTAEETENEGVIQMDSIDPENRAISVAHSLLLHKDASHISQRASIVKSRKVSDQLNKLDGGLSKLNARSSVNIPKPGVDSLALLPHFDISSRLLASSVAIAIEQPVEPADVEESTTSQEVEVQDTEKSTGEVEQYSELAENVNETLQFNRADIIAKYNIALINKELLTNANRSAQYKLSHQLKKKQQSERRDSLRLSPGDKYSKFMAEFRLLKGFIIENQKNYETQIQNAKIRCEEKQAKIEAERNELIQLKRRVVQKALFCHNKKPIPEAEIEKFLTASLIKEIEISRIRLENIKINNRMLSKTNILKSKEKLAEGLHLKDFEQLRIENQTFHEKIEEKNEELLKLKKKITSTVQILSHFKEKLQFFQVDNKHLQDELKVVEASLAKSRDILSRTKHARDALRVDNNKLRNDCGLLGNTSLINDYENLKCECSELHSKLEFMKDKHEELIERTSQLKDFIARARRKLGAHWTIQ